MTELHSEVGKLLTRARYRYLPITGSCISKDPLAQKKKSWEIMKTLCASQYCCDYHFALITSSNEAVK